MLREHRQLLSVGVDVSNSSHKGTPSYFLTTVLGLGLELSGISNPVIFKIKFSFSVVALQCCVRFYCTAK